MSSLFLKFFLHFIKKTLSFIKKPLCFASPTKKKVVTIALQVYRYTKLAQNLYIENSYIMFFPNNFVYLYTFKNCILISQINYSYIQDTTRDTNDTFCIPNLKKLEKNRNYNFLYLDINSK